jgi:hypothetical protein
MGEFNSSLTRVAPVLDRLLARDPIGMAWIPTLLRLAEPGKESLPTPLQLKRCWWGSNERGLRPPPTLLRWLVEHADLLTRDGLASSSPRVRQLRELLIGRDQSVRLAALELLQHAHRDRAWFVLEGVTFPDVYLETRNVILVIEGKRTEADITRITTLDADQAPDAPPY